MLDLMGVLSLVLSVLLSLLLVLKERTWISPLALVIIWVCFFILGDVAYSYWDGTYGPNENDREVLNDGDLGLASFAWGVAVSGFLVGYVIVMRDKRPLTHDFGLTRMPSTWLNPYARIGRIVTYLALCVSMTVMWILLLDSGNLKGRFLGSIGKTQEWFSEGDGIWLVAVRFLSVALLAGLFLSYAAKIKFPGWIILFVVVAAIELTIGSRSGLLYGFILPLMIGYHILRERISMAWLVFAAFAGALVVGVLYRSIVRDVGFKANVDLSSWEILEINLRRLPEMIWGGFEASSLDATVNIVNRYSGGERLLGETIGNGLLSFIPRTFWSEKPEGGANSIYTQEFFPSFYWEVGSEYSASYVGELFMNFGWGGVFVGFVLLGFLLGWLYIKCVRGYRPSVVGVFGVFIYSVIISRSYSLLRGDLYNFVNQLFISLFIGVLVFMLVWGIYGCIQSVLKGSDGTGCLRVFRIPTDTSRRA
jgi:oligosaccharide repeat unit polymerase